ncbi:acylneuraminate cytidylyltransferase family protein [Candidatus Pelagibacter ubique]|nr:acylneuraminate cytidylyltransferase family protein [Candidatus Pelagibacter ubique]
MRKGSKTIKNKNFNKINGKPLMYFTIKQAIESNLFDIVMVSTDSKKIYNYAKKYGAKVWFLRPKKLSTDTSPQLLAIKHALLESEKKFKTKFDIVFNLHVTSPLRNIDDIKNAFKLFLFEKKNQLISVSESYRNPYFNMIEQKNKKIYLVKNINRKIKNRQQAPRTFDMNASIYIWKRNFLLNSKKIINPNTTLYFMPKERSIDIDNNFDWKLVSYLMRSKLIKK